MDPFLFQINKKPKSKGKPGFTKNTHTQCASNNRWCIG